MDRLSHFHKLPNGRFKYMRRVPRELHGIGVGPRSGKWDLSLGSNYSKAVAKCVDLTRKHDHLIKSLADNDARDEFVRADSNADAAAFAGLVLGCETDITFAYNGTEVVVENEKPTPADAGWMRFQGGYEDDIPGELWRDTEAMLSSADSFQDEHAYHRLANFAAAAFDDHSFLVEDSPFASAIAKHQPPVRPDGASGAVFDALREALKPG